MSEKYTPEEAYRMHVEEATGSEPTTNFADLSDMAIQGYEVAADLLNQADQGSTFEPTPTAEDIEDLQREWESDNIPQPKEGRQRYEGKPIAPDWDSLLDD